jgi:hypothetical protein
MARVEMRFPEPISIVAIKANRYGLKLMSGDVEMAI